MKNQNKLRLLLIPALLLTFAACKKKDDDPGPVTPPVTSNVDTLQGDLDTRTLVASKKYLIKGQVFVRSGKVLTIEPGTILMGERASRGTLIVDRGGKIIAEGTAEKPIVMTSNQAAGERDRGDWGGLVILGNAPVNQTSPVIEGITPQAVFGGTDANDNSGVYKYVRVEFAGIELSPNNETNSITMGGVGKGTVMSHLMVSFGGDDGFEWFGGTVDMKYLICFAGWDDDFDVDYGYTGKVQFGLSVRYPGFADQSESNGFECDNGPNDNDVTPYTSATFSNFTVLGPIASGTSTSNRNFYASVDLRRRTHVSICNSVFAGFPRGLRMNQASVYNNYKSGSAVLKNNIFYFPGSTYEVGSGVVKDSVQALVAPGNTVVAEAASAAKNTELGINNDWYFGSKLSSAYPADPNFTVTSGTSASGASFSDPKLAGFENVAYRGAFGSTDWTNGWASFSPVNNAY
jgi:hypothetical protein